MKGQAAQKEIARRFQKSLLVQMLLKIQSIDCKELNDNGFRHELFMKVTESKSVYGYFNKGMVELLKYYGEPEVVIA